MEKKKVNLFVVILGFVFLCVGIIFLVSGIRDQIASNRKYEADFAQYEEDYDSWHDRWWNSHGQGVSVFDVPDMPTHENVGSAKLIFGGLSIFISIPIIIAGFAVDKAKTHTVFDRANIPTTNNNRSNSSNISTSYFECEYCGNRQTRDGKCNCCGGKTIKKDK